MMIGMIVDSKNVITLLSQLIPLKFHKYYELRFLSHKYEASV
jgi:hypothetical protein